MNNYLLYLLIFFAIYSYFLIRFFLNAQKPTNSTTECYVGGLGTGKTFLAVKRAVKIYKKAVFRWKIYKFFNKSSTLEKPQLISNIPIKINKKEWSIKLKAGHFLQFFKIPENSVILIDEVGNILPQTSYHTALHNEYITPFIRLLRHWFNGKLIVTDQSSGSINIEIRRRLNILYSLSKLSSKLFGKVFKINFFELVVSEDAQSVVNSNELNKNYFAGFFGRFKHYESRTFKKTYKALNKAVSEETFDNYFVDYYIDFASGYKIDKKLDYSLQLAEIKKQLKVGNFEKTL